MWMYTTVDSMIVHLLIGDRPADRMPGNSV